MRNDAKRKQKQIRSILKETDNPLIVEDVMDTEFGEMDDVTFADKNPTYGRGWRRFWR